MTPPRTIAGLVLAGGRSRRMGGGDKAFATLAGRTLLANALDRLGRQTTPLAISANGDDPRYRAFGLPVIRDGEPARAGPLSGILAGLEWAAAQEAAQLVTVAVDTPLFPHDLVSRLAGATKGDRIAIAASGGRRHPVFALWPVAAAKPLATFLQKGETRRVAAFADAFGAVLVDFDIGAYDPFLNANTPEDLDAITGLSDRLSQ